jgi:hypothetical protein
MKYERDILLEDEDREAQIKFPCYNSSIAAM